MTADACNVVTVSCTGDDEETTYTEQQHGRGELDEIFAACCGNNQSVCMGDAMSGYTQTSCISALDRFNNFCGESSAECGNLRFGSPGIANPTACNTARGNNMTIEYVKPSSAGRTLKGRLTGESKGR